MKKSVLVIVLSVLTLFAFAQFAFAIFTPTTPTGCSNANISAVWDSIFESSSSGITILTNTSDTTRCNIYFAYKIDGNYVRALSAMDTSALTLLGTVEGNFSTAYLDIIRNVTINNVSSNNSNFNLRSVVESNALPRSVNLSDASTLFDNTYKMPLGTWTENVSSTGTAYYFLQENVNVSGTYISGGIELANYSASQVNYIKIANLSVSSCTPSWTAINTSCNSSDYKIMWYNDTNNCSNSTGKPVNVSLSCDYDLNGIIGNFTSFSESNIDLELYINGSLGNISKNYTGTRQVIFREVDTEVDRLSFNYSFDSPLDIRGISAEIEDGDSHYGYIVVRGLNVTKTVRVDKLNSSSVRVCVKNSDGTIDDVTDNCDGYREYLVDCPGSSGSIRCSLDGNLFVVSGISRSIVKEWLNDLNDTVVSCTTNWTCTAFSECNSTGSKTKICTDRAFCNSTIGKPATVENCTYVNVCNANWNCSDWAPSECPSNLTQTRICRDTNVCNITAGKPNQSRTCVREDGVNWTLIGIIAGVVILLIIAVIIIVTKMNNKDDSNYVNVQGFGGPRSPPGGASPGGGYAPIIVRPMQRPPQAIPMQPRPMPMQPRPILNPSGMPMPPRTY